MKNETKMRPAIKNRILAVLAVLLLGVGILTSCVVFTDLCRTSSTRKALHTYGDLPSGKPDPYNKVSLNWGVMRMWTPYLEHAQSDADVRSFLAQAKKNTSLQIFSSSHGMAPISRWTENKAISIWDERCRSWFWSSSLSWQTRSYGQAGDHGVCNPHGKGSYQALRTRPLPSPTTTKIWWTP